MDIRKLQENLESRGFKVSYFDKKEDGAQYICEQIAGQKVGLGGSVTLDQMGMYEKLSENNEVLWHWRIPEGQTGADVLKAARSADVYLSSVNGISQDGQIVNIDNTGNRVAALCYGPETVYMLVGRNKIVKGGYQQAVARCKQYACPQNARRYNMDTPCATTGKCNVAECKTSLCHAFLALELKPNGIKNMKVLLIDEDLGY